MTWYAASLVKTVLLTTGRQDDYPVFESIVLLEAGSFDEVKEKAEEIGRLEEMAGQDLMYNGKAACTKFLGLRKIRKTHNLDSDDEIGSARPQSGTEILSSYFEVQNLEDLQKFVDGKRVTVSYVDDDD